MLHLALSSLLHSALLPCFSLSLVYLWFIFPCFLLLHPLSLPLASLSSLTHPCITLPNSSLHDFPFLTLASYPCRPFFTLLHSLLLLSPLSLTCNSLSFTYLYLCFTHSFSLSLSPLFTLALVSLVFPYSLISSSLLLHSIFISPFLTLPSYLLLHSPFLTLASSRSLHICCFTLLSSLSFPHARFITLASLSLHHSCFSLDSQFSLHHSCFTFMTLLSSLLLHSLILTLPSSPLLPSSFITLASLSSSLFHAPFSFALF